MQVVQGVASDIEWDHARESMMSSPVMTDADASDNFMDNLSVFDDADLEGDVFQMARDLSLQVATNVPPQPEPVVREAPLMPDPVAPTEIDQDADDEDDAYVPGEETTLKDVWVKKRKSTKLKMSASEEEFMGKVVLGTTWDKPVRWTYSNIKQLWNTVCKRGRLNKFLRNHEGYLKCASDGVYTPSSLAVDMWSDQWVRKWTDHC